MLPPLPPVGTPEHKAHHLGFCFAACIYAIVALQASKLVGAWGIFVGLPIFVGVSARVYDYVNRQRRSQRDALSRNGQSRRVKDHK